MRYHASNIFYLIVNYCFIISERDYQKESSDTCDLEQMTEETDTESKIHVHVDLF